MAEKLPSFGDFEMQVACTEALARLVTKSKRPKFAAEWFPNDKFASAFLAIQDLNFETVSSSWIIIPYAFFSPQ